MTTDIPDLLTRLAHTLRDANQTVTLTVPDARELHSLAHLGHTYLTAAHAWTTVGTTDMQPDAPQRLTPKREAALAAVQDDAMRTYQAANLALADELRAYRQDHP